MCCNQIRVTASFYNGQPVPQREVNSMHLQLAAIALLTAGPHAKHAAVQ